MCVEHCFTFYCVGGNAGAGMLWLEVGSLSVLLLLKAHNALCVSMYQSLKKIISSNHMAPYLSVYFLVPYTFSEWPSVCLCRDLFQSD